MATLNASHYTVGMAQILFATGAAKTPTGTAMGVDPTSFGNITVAEITPDVTYAEHYISVRGSRRRDKNVAINKSISVPFTFDELNSDNIRRFMLATEIDATASTAAVMKKEEFEGRAILNFQTDVGQKFLYVIPKCNLKADGGLAFSSDDWMSGNFSLEVLYHDTYRTAGSTLTELAPYGYLDFNETAIGSPF